MAREKDISKKKGLTRRDFIKTTAVAGAGLATGSVLFPKVLRGAEPPEILVGHIHPLSGPLAYLGNQLKNGTLMAINEINAAGGIKALGGAKLKLIDADSEGKPDLAISAVERLKSRGVVAITGCLQSAVTIVATQIAEKYQVPFIVSVAVADKVTERGFKYTFRVQPSAAQMAPQTVKFLSQISNQSNENVKTIAYIHDDTDFGTSLSDHVIKAAPNYGMELIARVPYSPKSADVSTQARKIKAANADVVMSSGYFGDQVRVFRAMRGLRVKPKAYVGCGSGGFSDENFSKELGKEMTEYVLDGNYQANPQSQMAQKMFAHYQELYGNKIPPSAVFAYQPIFVLADALERAKSTDRDDLREALADTHLTNHVLPQGPIVFDENGQNKNAQIAMTQFQDGKVKIVWPEKYAEANVVFPMPA